MSGTSERAQQSKASSAEQVNKGAARANEQTDGQVAQYFCLDSLVILDHSEREALSYFTHSRFMKNSFCRRGFFEKKKEEE